MIYVLRHEESVQHFKILKDANNRFYIWTSSSFSINQLVDKYHNENVSGDPRRVILLKDLTQEVSKSILKEDNNFSLLIDSRHMF